MRKRSIITTTVLLAFVSIFAQSSRAQELVCPTFSLNEVLSFQAIRSVQTAQSTYAATTGNGNFATLSQLGELGFIDPALASGIKYGYNFSVVLVPQGPKTPADFRLTATPRKYKTVWRYSFFADSSGVVRGGDLSGQPADETDPAIALEFCPGTIATNEPSVIQSLRTLHAAEITFAATSGNGQFTGLTGLRSVGLIGFPASTGLIFGYTTSVVVFPGTSSEPPAFRIVATPQVYGVTGVRSFFVDASGVVRGADRVGRPADESDPPIDK